MTTNKGSSITRYIIDDVISPKKAQWQIDRVYYGDQRILGDGTVVCVEPARNSSEPVTTSMGMRHEFETSIIIYTHGGNDGNEGAQARADMLLETIRDELNKIASAAELGLGGTQLGGLITHGWCISEEYGYRVPASQLIRANRLTFSSMSRTDLIIT